MNSESNTIRSLLLWLLTEFDVLDLLAPDAPILDPTFSLPSGNGSTSKAIRPEASLFEVGSDATSMKPIYRKGFEEASSDPSTLFESSTCFSTVLNDMGLDALLGGVVQPRFSTASRRGSVMEPRSQTAQSFNFGEIHAVQERFQALLKQRLLSEYENKPPLFPWEAEVGEYPAEVTDCASTDTVVSLWNRHVGTLTVPGLLPTDLVNTLFDRCQGIVRSPLKQGVRLVSAVEAFFPDCADLLEPIANMVLVPAYRSGKDTQDAVIQKLAGEPGGYDAAMPEQQVALSMLAAQEILNALTFDVSAEKPKSTRHWLTAVGLLELMVSCEDDLLEVSATLPKGGQIRLIDGDVEKSAVRSGAGALDLAWGKLEAAKTYVLEVSLRNESNPLNFVISYDA